MNFDLEKLSVIELVELQARYSREEYPAEHLLISNEIAKRKYDLEKKASENSIEVSEGRKFIENWPRRKKLAQIIFGIVILLILAQVATGRSIGSSAVLMVIVATAYISNIVKIEWLMKSPEFISNIQLAISKRDLSRNLRGPLHFKVVELLVFSGLIYLYVVISTNG